LEAIEVFHTLVEAIQAKPSLLAYFSHGIALNAVSRDEGVVDLAIVVLLHLLVIVLQTWILMLLEDIIVVIVEEQVDIALPAAAIAFRILVVIRYDFIFPHLENVDIHLQELAA
jgi:hypothetical protein